MLTLLGVKPTSVIESSVQAGDKPLHDWLEEYRNYDADILYRFVNSDSIISGDMDIDSQMNANGNSIAEGATRFVTCTSDCPDITE